MLEIRFNIKTMKVTGWWSNRHGNELAKLKNRSDEVIITLDAPIPDKPIEAWLYDSATKALIPDPNYLEPEPSISLASLDARLTALEDSIPFTTG